jgi:hypothetical protein
LHLMSEDSFGQGRAADIAKADHQYASAHMESLSRGTDDPIPRARYTAALEVECAL